MKVEFKNAGSAKTLYELGDAFVKRGSHEVIVLGMDHKERYVLINLSNMRTNVLAQCTNLMQVSDRINNSYTTYMYVPEVKLVVDLDGILLKGGNLDAIG